MLAPQLVNPGTPPPPQCAGYGGREALIGKAARLLAQWRGHEPDPEPQDWLTAERQISELLRVCDAALGTRAGARVATDTLQSQSRRT